MAIRDRPRVCRTAPRPTSRLSPAHGRSSATFATCPGTTLAATHGSLARVLVTAVILGIDPGLHRRMWLDHCHCAVVALDESPPRLVALNVDARNIGV